MRNSSLVMFRDSFENRCRITYFSSMFDLLILYFLNEPRLPDRMWWVNGCTHINVHIVAQLIRQHCLSVHRKN